MAPGSPTTVRPIRKGPPSSRGQQPLEPRVFDVQRSRIDLPAQVVPMGRPQSPPDPAIDAPSLHPRQPSRSTEEPVRSDGRDGSAKTRGPASALADGAAESVVQSVQVRSSQVIALDRGPMKIRPRVHLDPQPFRWAVDLLLLTVLISWPRLQHAALEGLEVGLAAVQVRCLTWRVDGEFHTGAA
jgi:hypothetical protein